MKERAYWGDVKHIGLRRSMHYRKEQERVLKRNDRYEIVRFGKEGSGRKVLVPRSHRDKCISEWNGWVLILFDHERVSGVSKSYPSRKKQALVINYWFISSEHMWW